MVGRVSIARINAMAQPAFVACLGGIFEHSPWVAERVFERRPFASRDALHAAMVDAVRNAGRDRQLALIRAHPELAGKAAKAGAMTRESTSEQRSAGLDRCTPAELSEIRELNRAYLDRLGFPFIMAVKGRSKGEILDQFRSRLDRSPDEEFEQSLNQIAKIAKLRLDALIENPPS